MKKVLYMVLISICLTGCSIGNMDNTPTKKVEQYLNNYQTLDKSVLSNLDTIVNRETTFTNTQKNDYRELLKKHYQNLIYKIKEETVNGDKATVETEIEVNDYTKVLNDASNYRKTNESEFINGLGVFDEVKFNDYRLNLLKSSKDRVKYTIYFSLTKANDEWTLENLTQTEQEKMLGIYEY